MAVAIMTMAGCTHNNGDIGDWFGTWHLKSIAVNDSPDTEYHGNIVWKFQNNIIEMIEADDTEHTALERYGTWSATDSELTLDFTHSDDRYPSGTGIYQPLPATHIPAAVSTLRILKRSSSEIILQFDSQDNTVIIYTLRRQG